MWPPAWLGACLAWRRACARGRYLNNTVAGTIKYGEIGSWDVSGVKSTARRVRVVKYPYQLSTLFRSLIALFHSFALHLLSMHAYGWKKERKYETRTKQERNNERNKDRFG